MSHLFKHLRAIAANPLTIALMLVVALSATASATTTGIDFEIPATVGGTISYAGGLNDPLVGLGIGDLGSITGISTPLHNGESRACLGCTLNFTTGDFWSIGVSGFTTILKFHPGGSFTINGTFDANNDGIADAGDVLNATLFDGVFVDEVDILYASGGPAKLLFGSLQDNKAVGLTDFFGLPSGVPYAGTLNLTFLASLGPSNDFTSSKVLSGDLFNTVPEPGTWLMVGLGFVAVGLRRFRRQ